MTEKSFYNKLLELNSNWEIDSIEIDDKECKVEVTIKYVNNVGICPISLAKDCRIYDYSDYRTWRHLDTMQYKTILKSRIPRVINTDGKVSTIEVPWADFSDHYTHLFTMAVIQLLQFNKNQTNTAKFFKISFDVVNRIMRKAVERGLARRDKTVVIESIGIDEKAFQQGHHYCTIITDATNKCVLEVVDGRTIESAKTAINAALSHQQQQTLQTVTGDMWAGFQTAVKETLPKVHYVLDRFHLVKYLNIAIDETRKEEVKTRPELKKQKYTLLKNEANLTTKQKLQFDLIKAGNFLVSRAWVVKENFKALFGQKDFASAAAIFEHWLYETSTYTIKAIKKVREMFLKHKIGIINALCNKVSNGYAERMNGAIQELKTIAKGFSKVDSFRTSILFYYGKLHLMPTQKSQ